MCAVILIDNELSLLSSPLSQLYIQILHTYRGALDEIFGVSCT